MTCPEFVVLVDDDGGLSVGRRIYRYQLGEMQSAYRKVMGIRPDDQDEMNDTWRKASAYVNWLNRGLADWQRDHSDARNKAERTDLIDVLREAQGQEMWQVADDILAHSDHWRGQVPAAAASVSAPVRQTNGEEKR